MLASVDGSVVLDDGVTTRAPITSLYTNSHYWKKCLNPVSQNWLDTRGLTLNQVILDDTDWLEVLHSKQATEWGSPLVLSAWHLTNNLLFGGVLSEPTIELKSLKNTYGLYQFVHGPPKGDVLTVNPKKNHSPLAVLTVTVHEAIHQYNYRIDWLKNGTFQPSNMGAHGDVFTAWIKPALQKLQVKVTWRKSLNEDDVVFDDPSKLATSSNSSYVLTVNIVSNKKVNIKPTVRFLAAKFDSLAETKESLRLAKAYFKGGSRIRILQINTPALLGQIKGGRARGGGGLTLSNATRLWEVSPPVFAGILQLGQPVA